MPRRPANRPSTGMKPEAVTNAVATSGDAAHQQVRGVVGDASATTTRSGDDTRKRGWFWHWNHVITQYAPLLGLKGVGLLNSYTVWTDRREESPHRGYAFPSQQSEADFYGEDRAELITINKILVALDLIEIRKEMVYRVDEKGRRWKVPHNFYRVKDQGDGVTLTARDVMRVVELADRDRAVYRYLKKLFSPRFAPIDPDNVWHQILEEVRLTESWQRLAERTARDESRASARSKAGHAARRNTDDSGLFSLPNDSDNATPEATVVDSGNDSSNVANDSAGVDAQTSVAATNTGLATDVAGTNKGLTDFDPSSVERTNSGPATSVAPTNRTYNQSNTTTTREARTAEMAPAEPEASETATAPEMPVATVVPPILAPPPDAARDEAIAIRRFEEANERPTTMAERRLLRNLAEAAEPFAAAASANGWSWVGDAIDEAVAAGSRFVAPKRIREILRRWQADGRDDAPTQAPERDMPAHVSRPERSAVTSRRRTARSADVAPEVTGPPAPFPVEECGLTSRQVWHSAVGQLRQTPEFGRAGAETWLRDTHLIGRTADGGFVVGVGNALALRRLDGHYRGAIERVLAELTGIDRRVTVADYRTWNPEAESAAS